MTDDTPLTVAQLEKALQPIKDQMNGFVTKDDLADVKAQMATKDDLKNFATKDDLLRYATKDDMENGFARLNDGIDRVLDVVININNRLTSNVEDHERRIKRLEKKTGLAQMAV